MSDHKVRKTYHEIRFYNDVTTSAADLQVHLRHLVPKRTETRRAVVQPARGRLPKSFVFIPLPMGIVRFRVEAK
jgi:hypothetical protein